MTDTTITKARKPFDAATLSALLPGLGHLYCGQFQRGILWMGASIGLMIAALGCLMTMPTTAGFALATILLIIDLGVWATCTIKAWRLAKGLPSPYTLREYNRWFVYAILLMACGFGSALGFAFVLRERVLQAFVIPTRSMAPTINQGDRILTLKDVYLDRDPSRGELVVFRNPEQRRQHYIKRVIGIAGDQVEWRANGEILLNGISLTHTPGDTANEFTEQNGDHRYSIRLQADTDTRAAPLGVLMVPPHHCFVLGDNRSLSKDSRHFGPIAYTSLVADPFVKVWGGFGPLN